VLSLPFLLARTFSGAFALPFSMPKFAAFLITNGVLAVGAADFATNPVN
jgi:hypothetical protein